MAPPDERTDAGADGAPADAAPAADGADDQEGPHADTSDRQEHANGDGSTDAATPPQDMPRAPARPAQPPRPPLTERLPWWTAPAILLGVPLLLWILIQVDSRTFYDRFVWKYYWGPIVADAQGQGFACSADPAVAGKAACDALGGVLAKSGYTLVNTLTWAGLLGVMILGTGQMLQRFKAQMDTKLILAAVAWTAAGSVWHVMQDADLFAPPLEYIFITPPIYLLFAGFGIVSFLIGQYLAYTQRQAGLQVALQKLWFIMAIGVLLYVALWARPWDQITHYVSPLWVAAIAAVSFFLIRWRMEAIRRIDPAELTLMLALPNFVLSIVYTLTFVQGEWGAGVQEDGLPSAWIVSTAGAALVCLIVYGVTRRARPVVAAAFAHPVNLLIIFAHVLDGLATAIGIDLLGYEEKHVLAEAIRRFTENTITQTYPTFVGFLPVKLAVAILVVWAIDVSGRDDARRHPVMTGLVKFAVIMVGIGPGIRNMVRMSLGV